MRTSQFHFLGSASTMAEPQFTESSHTFEPSPQTLFKQPSISMVLIRDPPNNTDCFVFPPINHENLQISPQFDPQEPDPPSPSPSLSPSSSSASSFSPSDVNWIDAPPPPPPETLPSPEFSSLVQNSGELKGWFVIGLDVLYTGLVRLASSFRNFVAVRGPIWSFARSAGVAAVVAVWFYRWVRRRQIHGRSGNQMMRVIEEKDEKITQLLHQIAQLNEVLLARHKVLTLKQKDLSGTIL